MYDTEANGLLNEATTIWCISTFDIQTKAKRTFTFDEVDRSELEPFFSQYDKIICHNQINYDLRLYKKLLRMDLEKVLGREAIIDTYVWSKAIYPDRPMPEGCPSIIRNKTLGISQRIGPHGLASWAYRFGDKKVQIDDWRVYTDEMITRCEGDVKINYLTFKYLLEEAGMTYEDL